MTTIVCDTNIVVGLLSRTDALHPAAVRAAAEWEEPAHAGRLILATGQHIGAAAVLTGDKRLARVAPGLAQLVVP